MKKRKNQEEKDLMKRWVFDHAYAMMDEFNMNRSEAFRRAHLACELVEALGQGIVVFEYVKQDGSSRLAQGTLCKGVSEKYDAYEYKTDSHDNDKYSKLDIPYWDLDKEAYRNFSVARIVKIYGVVIKSAPAGQKLDKIEPKIGQNDLIEFV